LDLGEGCMPQIALLKFFAAGPFRLHM